MAVDVIQCREKALPLSTDVFVQVTKDQATLRQDLTLPVFVSSGGSFEHGPGRIRYYSTIEAVEDDVDVSAEAIKAANAFFSQSRRPRQMAIGQVYSTPQAGYIKTGAIGALSAFTAVSNGSFAIAINGVSNNITGLNFSAATTLAQVASIIQTAVRAIGTGGFTLATVSIIGSSTAPQIKIISGTTGDTSTVSVLSAVSPASGTDISGPGFLNGRLGVAVVQLGYTPGDLPSELSLISEAAACASRYVYGWVLDEVYRDTAAQIAAAGWAAARLAIMPLVSNSPLAYDAGSTSDLAPTLVTNGNLRAWPIYHDNPDYYPDMAIAAIALSVDYAQPNSVLTLKFKDLINIPTVGVSQTQWAVLSGKGYNTFTRTGLTARTYREGSTANLSWYSDEVVNLDNFKVDLETDVYNVFLRNKVVPNTPRGQALLRESIFRICSRYVFNGTLAERQVSDETELSGFRIEPAFIITDGSFALQTAAERFARQGPPFTVQLNLAGAIHSIRIDAEART